MSLSRYDVVVVGGGIVGLATAMTLAERHPSATVAVVEKEPVVGAHQTSHNSGVIHAGIYYAPGSMKARFCTTGRDMMKAFCREEGVRFEECGKVIVAVEKRELPGLEALHARAIRNGVPGVRLIDRDRLREIEPHVEGLRALYSPATGIVDYAEVARAYARRLEAEGGELLLGREVVSIVEEGPFVRVVTTEGDLDARFVVTCTGLQADRTAKAAGIDDEDLRVVPFRGSYWLIRPERSDLIRGCVYPVPDPRLPFLGVHFTPRLSDGQIMVGPNAILALAREHYRRTALNPRDAADLLAWPGTWRVVRRFLGHGLVQLQRDLSRKAYAADAQRYVPELTADDLIPGPTGVRAQTVSRNGDMTDDFLVTRRDRILHVQNAPSPAATASLALGNHLAGLAEEAMSEVA